MYCDPLYRSAMYIRPGITVKEKFARSKRIGLIANLRILIDCECSVGRS